MCLRRAPEKHIAGVKAPAGAALDRAAQEDQTVSTVLCIVTVKKQSKWLCSCCVVHSPSELAEHSDVAHNVVMEALN
jgi:hypothetical protein